jgi:hypothetical protein
LVLKQLTTVMAVDHRLVTPYHPRANGIAERNVQSAIDIIRKRVKEQKATWAQHLPATQLAMNTRVVALHNSSPFSLFFARRANGFNNYKDDKGELLTQEQLLERLQYMTEVVFPAINQKARAAQKRMVERFNATVLHNDFPDGAKVMTLDPIKGAKLKARYEGPYTVVRRTTHGAYELKDGTGELLTRHYAPSQLKLVIEDLDELPIFEVDRILEHRPSTTIPGAWEYHTTWKGYEETTWEPESHFVEQQAVPRYWKSLGPNAEQRERAKHAQALQAAAERSSKRPQASRRAKGGESRLNTNPEPNKRRRTIQNPNTTKAPSTANPANPEPSTRRSERLAQR